jgi:hypothetical protein
MILLIVLANLGQTKVKKKLLAKNDCCHLRLKDKGDNLQKEKPAIC